VYSAEHMAAHLIEKFQGQGIGVNLIHREQPQLS
jgi:hypothetical protein